jgi:predicted dehydrogenase
MSNDLRCGVVGLGIGEQHVQAIKRDTACSVVAICDSDAEKLSKVQARYDIEYAYEDFDKFIESNNLDVIVIASKDSDHFDQAVKAIECDCHVFVEKPICETLGQLKQLRDLLSQRGNLFFNSNLILRAEPLFKALKQRIASGELGEIYHVETTYDYGRWFKVTNGWRGHINSYSAMAGGGVHLIDLIQWATGKRITFHSAASSNVVGKLDHISFPDVQLALGRLPNGGIVKITANLSSVVSHFHQLKLYGTQGTFVLDCGEAQYFFDRDNVRRSERSHERFPSAHKGALLTTFLDDIKSGNVCDILGDSIFSSLEFALQVNEYGE